MMSNALKVAIVGLELCASVLMLKVMIVFWIFFSSFHIRYVGFGQNHDVLIQAKVFYLNSYLLFPTLINASVLTVIQEQWKLNINKRTIGKKVDLHKNSNMYAPYR